MTAISINVEHEGASYTGKIGTIVNTTLGIHEHYGLMTYELLVSLGGGLKVGVGGYGLEARTGSGISHLRRVVETVGTADWEHLTGAKTLVLFDAKTDSTVGLASLDGGEVFILSEHAEKHAAAKD